MSQKKRTQELTKNVLFWMNNCIHSESNTLYSGVSIQGVPLTTEPLGAMYLSRILYGASTASELLKTTDYLKLATISFQELETFKNPKGGYYWSKISAHKFINAPDDVNMAQAFILYGFVAYAKINPSKTLDKLIEKQANFIKNTLWDAKNSGFIDGFDEHWNLGNSPTKSLGTHLHTLEAFVALYEYQQDSSILPIIEELITLILTHFITKDTFDCIHRLTIQWKPLKNEVWAGHNAECSWILCDAANTTKNEALISQCNATALKMMSQVIQKAIDTKNGGLFNVLENGTPTETVKIWWPQAEMVLALLNCYNITHDSLYKDLALEFSTYISTQFIAPNGEWYTEIKNSGQPTTEIPIVHFWKSMYHTVRYYFMVEKFSH
ncbi:AGE family epimerase/isomerase [Lutibacter sp.]|uniref:AGE family epimerase/isomerase n=1 Tax=Lutibacter sp. TaxID=1925666 RepID=UPI001A35610D|nr:AGE family epimerase/isomerase [Lutibacter sp.]MBI9041927.1 AGE family epimerase/isomerase [Lutibacter sp.]